MEMFAFNIVRWNFRSYELKVNVKLICYNLLKLSFRISFNFFINETKSTRQYLR